MATPFINIHWTPIPEGVATCAVSPLVNATLSVPEAVVLQPSSSPTASYRVPAFCFYIVHNPSGTTYLFDLGVRKDWQTANDVKFRESVQHPWNPMVTSDVADLLIEKGVDPESVNGILLSHEHWAHTGNIGRFPQTGIIGARNTFSHTCTGACASDLELQIAANPNRVIRAIDFFDPVGEGICPVGAFDRCYDLFEDGSLWLCLTPGHTPGHISALIRTTPSPDATYLLLAGDTCHHPVMLSSGESATGFSISRYHLPTDPDDAVPRSMHTDLALSFSSIMRTRLMEMQDNVMVILSHDYQYWRLWTAPLPGEEVGPGELSLFAQHVLFPGTALTQWKASGLKMEREYHPEGYEQK